MAATVQLTAKPRSGTGKGVARKLRASGWIPAVVYGHGEPARALMVEARAFERLLSHTALETTLVELTIEGVGAVRALVREVQRHPVRPEILHVDFYQVHRGERIRLDVPVRLVGKPQGVEVGGLLDHVLHTLHVECEADRIPEAIEVDVSGLGLGDSLHVRDLVPPEGVRVLTPVDETIATVLATAAAEAAEAEVAGGPELPEPEVIRRGRAEEEEAAE